jgi:hypothetical protein
MALPRPLMLCALWTQKVILDAYFDKKNTIFSIWPTSCHLYVSRSRHFDSPVTVMYETPTGA